MLAPRRGTGTRGGFPTRSKTLFSTSGNNLNVEILDLKLFTEKGPKTDSNGLPKPKNEYRTVLLPIKYRLQRITQTHDAFWLPGQRKRKKVLPLSSLRKSPTVELARGSKEWPSFPSLSAHMTAALEHHLGPRSPCSTS